LTNPFEPGRIRAGVKVIHIHPDWNTLTTSYDADIAILELVNEVEFSDYIQPICLAEPGSVAALETLGYVIGYKTFNGSIIDDITRLVAAPIHSNQACLAYEHMYDSILSNRGFCGGYANRTGDCYADSHGLIVVHNNRHYIRGILSASLFNFIDGCESYSIYADILKFYDWITSYTNHPIAWKG